MPKIVYLSYTQRDARLQDLVVDWHADGELGSNCVITYEPPNIRPRDPMEVYPGASINLRNAGILVCLVGSDTWQYRWINDEVADAAAKGKKILALKQQPTYRTPPAVTEAGGTVLTPFSASVLKAAIEAA